MRGILAVALAVFAGSIAGGQQSGRVQPLFDLSSMERHAFPSDRFTVADPSQNTGRRVNLPVPSDCAANASDCEDVAVLNQLDGFNMQPRLSIPFSGDIDPASVTKESVFLLRLGGSGAGTIGVNYVVWDPATKELSGRPDESLDERVSYALAVTTAVRDAAGNPIAVADGFRRYRDMLSREADSYYRRQLDAAAERVAGSLPRATLATLSVFTTQSSSHIVQRMREAIDRASAPRLDFSVGPDGARAVFDASRIDTIVNNADLRVAGPLTDQPPAGFRAMRVIPGAVGTIAFGRFRTLDFTAHPSGHIAPIPTRTGTLQATGSVETAFNLWLPAGPLPARGWPVVVYAPGSFASKNTGFSQAAVFNSHGLAVISINALGRGGGPRTTMTARLVDGTTMTFAAPGLGADSDGDGTIGDWEPRRARPPYRILNNSGPMGETVAQHFALVRAIQAGVDVDGNGRLDLDASRIYYLGQSLGAMTGIPIFRYEPAIRAAAFAVPTGTLPYANLLSTGDRPGFATDLLASREPSLLNEANGIAELDGVQIPAPRFNENIPLRGRPPLVNTVPGAPAIQRFVDRVVWATQFTSTVAFAPLVRGSGRPYIFQFARSDQFTANPSSSELIRAGGFADRVFFYRHDRNLGEGILPNPHPFLSAFGQPDMQRIALGAQHQIAAFFESDGSKIAAPEPADLWEAPIRLPLPEDLFFLPRRR